MLRNRDLAIKVIVLIAFVSSLAGCAISDANIKSIDSYEKPNEGNGLVFFSTALDSHTWLGIGASGLLKFSKYEDTDYNNMKLEIMSVSPEKLHVLDLPEGKYIFHGFHFENANFNSSWDLWCDNCFVFPFVVKAGYISYAGSLDLAISKRKSKVKVGYSDRFESDIKLLKEKIYDIDVFLIEKPYIQEQSRVIDVR